MQDEQKMKVTNMQKEDDMQKEDARPYAMVCCKLLAWGGGGWEGNFIAPLPYLAPCSPASGSPRMSLEAQTFTFMNPLICSSRARPSSPWATDEARISTLAKWLSALRNLVATLVKKSFSSESSRKVAILATLL